MKLIIDGYNVIHQIEQLRGKRLRSQREGLIRLLEIAQAQNRRFKDITVVFDGQSGILAPQAPSNVKIIFSKGKNADAKIKEIVESSSFARDTGVVSDDREVSSYVSALGAKKVTVKDFLRAILAVSVRPDNCAFKLDQAEAEKINRELEKVWLDGKGK